MHAFQVKPLAALFVFAFAATASGEQAPTHRAAQDAGKVTLEQVVTKTLLSNPEIQARYNDFVSSKEAQNIAYGGMLPQVNGRAYIGHEWQRNLPGGDSASWNRPGYGLELRQLLFDGFRVSNDFKRAGFEKLARYYDLLATTDDTAFRAVQAYIDVERHRTLESLARENYTLHETTLQQIEHRADAGISRRVDHLQAGGRLSLAQSNLMTESANLNDVMQRFRRITNLDVPTALTPPASIDDKIPKAPRDFNELLRGNPGFLSKQALLQAAAAKMQSATGALAPKFEFVASTGTDTSQPGPEYKNVRSSNVQLVMSHNLYRGGADSANIRQAAAQSYGARDVRDYTCRNIQQDLATTFNKVQHLRQALPFLRDHEVATSKVREAYRQQFQIGQRTLLDLLDTEDELFDARRALVNSTYDLQVAQYRWLALSHRLLSTLGLTPAQQDTPEELHRLDVSDAVMALCNSTVPDIGRLEPVKVIYSEGALPPRLERADKSH